MFHRTFVLAIAATVVTIGVHCDMARASTICGDVNASDSLTASDSLLVLRAAVGLESNLICPVSTAQTLQTGQSRCFDTVGTEIACAGTGQDGEFHNGSEASFKDNGDGTVTDQRTGLTWEKLSDDGSIHDKDNRYDWAGAFTIKVAGLNAEQFAGHGDWRVPSQFELFSLVNLGATWPSTYPPFSAGCTDTCTVTTCNCTQSSRYWSSSTVQDSPTFAWGIPFDGSYSIGFAKTARNFVRAVRGGS